MYNKIMNGYDLMMKPLEKHALHGLRQKYIGQAKGKVLEIGAGTGVNLKYYKNVDLTLTDQTKSKVLSNDYNFLACQVEALPFNEHSFDTVVSTLVFCTADVKRGLEEILRVLKPGGRLIFIEHVLPKENPSRTLFNVLTPVWKRLASGCHLNRDFLEYIGESSFILDDYEYEMGTKFLAGIARRQND